MAKADKAKIRSARGTGRLYKRTKDGQELRADSKAPGVFWLQYTANGKRVRYALTGKDGKPIKDLREAEAERKRLTAPMRAGRRTEQLHALTAALSQAEGVEVQAVENAAPLLRLADAWEIYLRSPDRPDSGEGTLRNYAGHWERFEKWLALQDPEPLTLREITPQMAQDYAETLNGGTGTSPNTYNKHTAFLKMFFRVLSDAAGLKENPFDKIRRKNLKTNSRRELTLAELKDLLETATGDLQTLFYLGTFTGLRLGDCCTLSWGEVDLDRGLIRRIPNKTAKSGKPVLIGIPAALHEKLSETLPARRKGYVLPRFAELYTYRNAKGRPSKQPMIALEIQAHFKARKMTTHKEGTGYRTAPDPDNPGQTKEVYTGKRAVLEVGFHSLRHTWVSLHAAAGTPQGVIQNVIGHANPSMTAHYTHVNEDTARHTAEAWQLNEPEKGRAPAAPVPAWVIKKLAGMTMKNWKQIRAELTGGTK
jgi:integrase